MTAPDNKPTSLAEIFNEYTKKVVLSLGTSTEPVNTQRIFQARDEAIAAVLALLPEKQIPYWRSHKGDEIDHARAIGHDEAIDQTRRNLIGEQR